MTVRLLLSCSCSVILAALAATSAENRSERSFSWIEDRVQALQPSSKEKRFDQIGWAPDIRTAEKLARENNRPVFLFTHDGRMNIGRC